MSAALRVGGFVPLTTIDYPDHLACVVFCQGCAWRCGYCHNPELLAVQGAAQITWAQVLRFLQQRQGLLDAVVFSGGEASLQNALLPAMQQVKALGFKVGLHSAGIKPSALARLLPWLDWLGFDLKGPRELIDHITGVRGSAEANWQSLELVLASKVAHEIRLTWHPQLIPEPALRDMAQPLAERGVQRLVVQPVQHQQTLLDGRLPRVLISEVQRAALNEYFAGQGVVLQWR